MYASTRSRVRSTDWPSAMTISSGRRVEANTASSVGPTDRSSFLTGMMSATVRRFVARAVNVLPLPQRTGESSTQDIGQTRRAYLGLMPPFSKDLLNHRQSMRELIDTR